MTTGEKSDTMIKSCDITFRDYRKSRHMHQSTYGRAQNGNGFIMKVTSTAETPVDENYISQILRLTINI